MRLGKTVLVVVGATVLLAALVGAASAARLSASARTVNATFARIDFRGGLGVVECEAIINGSFHERTITKTVLTLSGLITAANINRCPRGGSSVLRETLPWHIRYSSFAGSLPTISSITARIIGLSVIVSEPVFEIECLLRSTPETPGLVIFNRETGTGATISASVGGSIRCASFNGTLSGTTTNTAEGGGARVTVTLI